MKVLHSPPIALREYLFALAYLVVVLLIGYFATRQGVSQYLSARAFRSGSYADAAAAARFDPQSPEALDVGGMLFLRNDEYAAAGDAFQRATVLRQNDFLLWLRLGYSRQRSGDFDSARSAFGRALEIAPNYAQPNYYMGKMLLEAGAVDEAFRFLSKAASINKLLYPEVLHLARQKFPADPQSIERVVQPASLEGKTIIARYMIERDLLTEDLKTFITSDQLTADAKGEFVKLLLQRGNVQAAYEVWYASNGANMADRQNVFDGGFENLSASDETGFGWRIDRNLPAITVSRDATAASAGSASLQIKFSGNSQLAANIFSQLVLLEPRRKYQLRFAYNSPEMISAGLPAIVVSDSGGTRLGRSATLANTGGKWVQAKFDFATTDTIGVVISLQRPECSDSPCPVFGELLLDDFSINKN